MIHQGSTCIAENPNTTSVLALESPPIDIDITMRMTDNTQNMFQNQNQSYENEIQNPSDANNNNNNNNNNYECQHHFENLIPLDKIIETPKFQYEYHNIGLKICTVETPIHGLSTTTPVDRLSTPTHRLSITPKSSPSNIGSFGKAKWQKISNVFFTVQSLKKERVEKIMNESHLYRNVGIEKEKTKQNLNAQKNESKNDPLKEFIDRAYLFKCIERGSEQDCTNVKFLIENDPKRFILEHNSPERICNKPYINGQTPLYIACKHGNLKMVKLLINNEANPFQLCQITPIKQESILDVAVRWSHLSIVEYLINNFKWPNAIIKEALSHSTNKNITKLLKTKMEYTPKNSCFSLFSSKKSYQK